MTEIYRYSFPSHVAVEDIEATLLLALWGAESLHGETQVRLDEAHVLDRNRKSCVIDAATPVGRDINRLFTGFVRREFGDGGFVVQRLDEVPQAAKENV